MNKQRGNILWIVLVSIALLGLITAMFTRSSGTSEDTGNFEQTSITASGILRNAKALQLAVENLTSRGCSENQISFWDDSNGDDVEDSNDDFYNANSPSNKSCHVFKQEGAGLAYIQSEKLIKGGLWGTSGTLNAVKYNQFALSHQIIGVGTSGAGAASSDLYWALELPYNINRAALCTEINRQMGHAVIVPPLSTLSVASKYTGSFSAVSLISTPEFDGKSGYCYNWSADPQRYIFYFVLLAR